jgi:large subunit ribosomal protein L3
MGRKRGMTQFFDKTGKMIPCTVIEVEPNIVTQIKTVEKDGYNAIQLGCDVVKVNKEETLKKRLSNPLIGHFEKSGIAPRKTLQEARVDNVQDYSLGQEIRVDLFKDVAHIDARAVSIGKGFAGVMKRWGFKGMRATHGVSAVHRSGGSTGNRSTPGRCFKNKKMPGHMGSKPITVQNLKVIEVNEQENCIIVQGAVPGPKNGLVTLKPSVKKRKV